MLTDSPVARPALLVSQALPALPAPLVLTVPRARLALPAHKVLTPQSPGLSALPVQRGPQGPQVLTQRLPVLPATLAQRARLVLTQRSSDQQVQAAQARPAQQDLPVLTLQSLAQQVLQAKRASPAQRVRTLQS